MNLNQFIYYVFIYSKGFIKMACKVLNAKGTSLKRDGTLVPMIHRVSRGFMKLAKC